MTDTMADPFRYFANIRLLLSFQLQCSLVLVILLTFATFQTGELRTIPPTAAIGCVHEGKFYRPGTDISRGQFGEWCYGVKCSPTGDIFNWDNFNCLSGTTTRKSASTARPVCQWGGKSYNPGEQIYRRQTGSRCYGSYCDENGQVINWNNANCATTTTRIPSTYKITRKTSTTSPAPPQTSTSISILQPPTSVKPSLDGCTYKGRYYRPGETINRDENGCGESCVGAEKRIQFPCQPPATTYVPTSVPPTPPPRTPPPRTPTLRTPPPRTPIIRTPPPRTPPTTFLSLISTVPPTPPLPPSPPPSSTTPQSPPPGKRENTTPLETTTSTLQMTGCFHDGKRYKPGEEISRSKTGNWCYGTYCGENGGIIAWDDWNCGTTMSVRPTTTAPTTTLPTRDARTTTVPTTPPAPNGCLHQGKVYPYGTKFGEGKSGNWCYGMFCNNDGHILAWDDFNCYPSTTSITTKTVTTTTVPHTTLKLCLYKGSTYFPGQTINRDADGCGKYCDKNGKVVPISCKRSTIPTAVPRESEGCNVGEKLFKPGEEISRKQNGNRCYGTLCDDNGEIIAWDDFNCGTESTTVPAVIATKGCLYDGQTYKPGQKITRPDRNGCKVYCSLEGRIRVERFPCKKPLITRQTERTTYKTTTAAPVAKESQDPCIGPDGADSNVKLDVTCSGAPYASQSVALNAFVLSSSILLGIFLSS